MSIRKLAIQPPQSILQLVLDLDIGDLDSLGQMKQHTQSECATSIVLVCKTHIFTFDHKHNCICNVFIFDESRVLEVTTFRVKR